jgi:hypothetical protein
VTGAEDPVVTLPLGPRPANAQATKLAGKGTQISVTGTRNRFASFQDSEASEE